MKQDCLLLNNNELREITGLYEILTGVLLHGDPSKLIWINLSFNYLTKIDDEILNFVNLKSLNLHGNYINEIEEVKKLGELGALQNLTLNGNPIEEVKGYRCYVLGLMYQRYETLKKLDSIIITNKEFDNAIVWNEHLNKKHLTT